jgi:3-deoxy-manno-octulosonate cytidylyltransferase (CMP-KDO synthetase)
MSQADIATMYEKISSENDLFNYNVVKLVKDVNNNALYFSRNAIPAHRDLAYKDWIKSHTYLRHVGVYGFKKEVLHKIIQLPSSSWEIAEKLEQLKWLENGFTIKVCENEYYSKGVDTIEDYENILKLIEKNRD